MSEEIKHGDLVAINSLDDATVFKVVERVGQFKLGVREAGRPQYAVQFIDRSLCEPATAEQCHNHLKDLP